MLSLFAFICTFKSPVEVCVAVLFVNSANNQAGALITLISFTDMQCEERVSVHIEPAFRQAE